VYVELSHNLNKEGVVGGMYIPLLGVCGVTPQGKKKNLVFTGNFSIEFAPLFQKWKDTRYENI
jgi:hypothetical protein